MGVVSDPSCFWISGEAGRGFWSVAFVAFAFGAIVVEAAYAEGPLWSIFGSQTMLVLTGTVVLLVVLCMASVAMAQPSSNPFGLMPGSFQLVPSTVAAGAHEDLVTKFDFTHNAKGEPLTICAGRLWNCLLVSQVTIRRYPRVLTHSFSGIAKLR